MIVKVQDEMREGLSDLVRALIKATGLAHVMTAVNQWLCGQGDPGHHYAVGMIGGDGCTWVLDPSCLCKKCGAPMSDDAYERMAVMYAQMTASDADSDDADTDELW